MKASVEIIGGGDHLDALGVKPRIGVDGLDLTRAAAPAFEDQSPPIVVLTASSVSG